jgi:stage V sporulation protein R
MRRIVADFNNEWTRELIEEIYNGIHSIAVDEWGYNIYRNQIEIISDEGMLEAYATIGLPIMFPHWSFGKRYLSQSKQYKAGLMGLAYEIVINSDPCIAYLMAGNTLTMQTLVVAHACFGHNHFFKNNYLFKQWTQPDGIIDYLAYAKRFMERCEERYGIEEVERIIDSAHAISHYSVDKYHRVKKTKTQLELDMRSRMEWEDQQYNPVVDAFRDKNAVPDEDEEEGDQTENLLYFIEKKSPDLEVWQREVIRIIRMIGQYFYPQKQLQNMNEGFATATHYEILHELEKRGLVDEGFMLEFIRSHAGVLNMQSATSDPAGSLRMLQPYAFGFRMFMDMKRRALTPTKEDERLFPDQVGRPHRDVWFEAVENFKDESFIEQYLSPQVVQDMRLMSVLDSDKLDHYKITGIADDESFFHLRTQLSRQYDLGSQTPQISVYSVDWKNSRTLKLRHNARGRRPLQPTDARKVLRHIHRLWKFPVSVESYDGENEMRGQIHNYP